MVDRGVPQESILVPVLFSCRCCHKVKLHAGAWAYFTARQKNCGPIQASARWASEWVAVMVKGLSLAVYVLGIKRLYKSFIIFIHSFIIHIDYHNNHLYYLKRQNISAFWSERHGLNMLGPFSCYSQSIHFTINFTTLMIMHKVLCGPAPDDALHQCISRGPLRSRHRPGGSSSLKSNQMVGWLSACHAGP